MTITVKFPAALGADLFGRYSGPADLASQRRTAAADASVAEAAQRRRIRRVLSIDADFDVYRDKAGKPLVNLLRR